MASGLGGIPVRSKYTLLKSTSFGADFEGLSPFSLSFFITKPSISLAPHSGLIGSAFLGIGGIKAQCSW